MSTPPTEPVTAIASAPQRKISVRWDFVLSCVSKAGRVAYDATWFFGLMASPWFVMQDTELAFTGSLLLGYTMLASLLLHAKKMDAYLAVALLLLSIAAPLSSAALSPLVQGQDLGSVFKVLPIFMFGYAAMSFPFCLLFRERKVSGDTALLLSSIAFPASAYLADYLVPSENSFMIVLGPLVATTIYMAVALSIVVSDHRPLETARAAPRIVHTWISKLADKLFIVENG